MFCTNSPADEKIGRLDIADGFWQCVIGRSKRRGKRGIRLTGKIFSIEEFSTYDGPGIRTTVFMKGCPLSCSWCHNPEGQSFETQYIRSPNGCLKCGKCEYAGKRIGETIILTEKSAEACPRGLVRVCGIEYTSRQLADRLNMNAEILRTWGGGVTFSGGEPLCAIDFISETVKFLKKGISVCFQTSGFSSAEVFEKALSVSDFILYDLKLMDNDEFRKFCGADNLCILHNYKILAKSGVPFVTRIPLIPNVTDTEKNLKAIARFMYDNEVNYAELLPYNKYAGGKYRGLLRDYNPGFDESLPVCARKDIFERYHVIIKIM